MYLKNETGSEHLVEPMFNQIITFSMAFNNMNPQ